MTIQYKTWHEINNYNAKLITELSSSKKSNG